MAFASLLRKAGFDSLAADTQGVPSSAAVPARVGRRVGPSWPVAALPREVCRPEEPAGPVSCQTVARCPLRWMTSRVAPKSLAGRPAEESEASCSFFDIPGSTRLSAGMPSILSGKPNRMSNCLAVTSLNHLSLHLDIRLTIEAVHRLIRPATRRAFRFKAVLPPAFVLYGGLTITSWLHGCKGDTSLTPMFSGFYL
jgi:hypothetical protein